MEILIMVTREDFNEVKQEYWCFRLCSLLNPETLDSYLKAKADSEGFTAERRIYIWNTFTDMPTIIQNMKKEEEQERLNKLKIVEDLNNQEQSYELDVVTLQGIHNDSYYLDTPTFSQEVLSLGGITCSLSDHHAHTRSVTPESYTTIFDLSTMKEVVGWEPMRKVSYEEPMPMDLIEVIKPKYPHYKDGGVECTFPAGLETTIIKAWASPEWSIHPLVASTQSKANLKKFIARTKYLFSSSRSTGHTRLSDLVIRKTCGDNFDQGKHWINLITTQYTTKTKKLKVRIMEYTDGNHFTHGKATWDEFLTKHMGLITEIVKNPSVVKVYKGHIDTLHMKMMGNRILRTESLHYTELTPPSREAVVAKIKNLTELPEEHKDFLTVKEGEDYLANFDRNVGSNTFFYTKYGQDRHYGPYIFLPSAIRKMYLWNGRPLTWLDYSSMHPTILMMMYMASPPVENNNPYIDHAKECLLIKEILGIDRDYMDIPEWNPRNKLLQLATLHGVKIEEKHLKIENLSYYNMSQKQVKFMKIDKLYRKILPGFREWLAQIKTKTKMGHETVSKLMLNQEAVIMEAVIKAIWDAGIYACGAHDGVDVDPDRAWEADIIFRRIILGFDLPPNISDK